MHCTSKNTTQPLKKLSNGFVMPILGLGTYKSAPKDVKQAVKDAIDTNYRHFDCAWYYQNEEDIGAALKEKIQEGAVKRGDLFITSKLWNNFHAPSDVGPMIQDTLKKLQMDYLDLYLMHWPFGFKKDAPFWPTDKGPEAWSDVDYLDTWKAMEECVEKGLAKSIGVSNFSVSQLERLLMSAKIKPVCNQIEVNPNYVPKCLIDYCLQNDIAIVGYRPLGKNPNAGVGCVPQSPIDDPKIIEIGKKHKKSSAQVILNYLASLGISVIPKSVTKSRIEENFNIFDFELSEDEKKYMESLNKNNKIVKALEFKNHPYYPF